MSRAAHMAAHPDFLWLDPEAPERLEAHLRAQGWLLPQERLQSCGPAGEGNMNLTLRVRTKGRSFIVKQSRPWVERYDQIDAPWGRIELEVRFYERVQRIPALAERTPKLLGHDRASRTMALEDLGEARDFSGLYRAGALSPQTLDEAMDFLSALHEGTRGPPDPAFENREMRALNHQHIFVIPFQENNGVDLDALEPGLSAAAALLRKDGSLRSQVEDLGARYLEDGPCLLHGDYFFGSWLDTAAGLRVIDPEFCFYGDPELDLGVLLGHLALAAQTTALSQRALQRYGASALDQALLARFAAVEVMRRILGVAQLPIPPSEPQGARRRAPLLLRAAEALRSGSLRSLFAG